MHYTILLFDKLFDVKTELCKGESFNYGKLIYKSLKLEVSSSCDMMSASPFVVFVVFLLGICPGKLIFLNYYPFSFEQFI